MRWLVLLSLAVGLCSGMRAQETGAQRGSICGVVQDENGDPAANTKVVAMYRGPHSGPYPMGQTDAAGHYCINGLSVGEYGLSAADEEKGYPSLDRMFYTTQPAPSVAITAASLHGSLDWRIPYKAGFLHIAVRHAATGEPVKTMLVSLVLRTNGEYRYMHMSAPSDLVILVPPDEDIYVNVASDGFRWWPDDGSQGMLLNLRSGQTQTLTVPLTPR